MLQVSEPIKQKIADTPAMVGEIVAIRHAKNAITTPTIPAQRPLHKRRTPR